MMSLVPVRMVRMVVRVDVSPQVITWAIPDYRTMAHAGVEQPSADLLDAIFQCQQRQEWYRSYAQVNQEDPVSFVGSVTTASPVVEAASAMGRTLSFGVDERGATFTETLRRLAEAAEEAGVLVMVNGVAHLWLGETALSDADLTARPIVDAERWCNQVAAEFLVPLASVSEDFDRDAELTDELDRLAKRFKVSTLVVLRRIHDAGHLTWDAYRRAYRDELERVLELLGERADSGGNFYNTQPVRVSKRFARALISSTLQGQTLYNEAFEMLGFKKHSTFQELAERLGVT
jgi:Zn-dependent peptidase ImmA (M78 family)